MGTSGVVLIRFIWFYIRFSVHGIFDSMDSMDSVESRESMDSLESMENNGNPWNSLKFMDIQWTYMDSPESEIVMVDRTFFDDSFKQDRSWVDSGTTISGI